MPEQDNSTITLEKFKEKVKNENFSYDDFKHIYDQMKDTRKEFISLLECACKIKKDDKDLNNLLRKVGLDSISEIMEELKNLGFGIQKDLGEDFQKQGYRLLEQTRAGKRNDVMYGITRIFMVHQRNLPEVLNEAFKPYYDIETFQCFMYAFLGTAIKPKEKEQNKKEE